MNVGVVVYLMYLSGVLEDRVKIVSDKKSIEDYRSCLIETGINPDFRKRKIKLTKEQKICVESCDLKQLGIMSSKGTWDREKLNILEEREDGLKGLDGFRDILDVCEGQGKTSCKLLSCVYDEAIRKEDYSQLLYELLFH